MLLHKLIFGIEGNSFLHNITQIRTLSESEHMSKFMINRTFRTTVSGICKVIIIEYTFIHRGTFNIPVFRIIQYKDIYLVTVLIYPLELPVKIIISPVAVPVIFSIRILHMLNFLEFSHYLIYEKSCVSRNLRILLKEDIKVISFKICMLIKLHQFIRITAEYYLTVSSACLICNVSLSIT